MSALIPTTAAFQLKISTPTRRGERQAIMAIASIVKLGVAGMFLALICGCKTANESMTVSDPSGRRVYESTDGPFSSNKKTVVDSSYPTGMVGGGAIMGYAYPMVPYQVISPADSSDMLNHSTSAVVPIPGTSSGGMSSSDGPTSAEFSAVVKETKKNKSANCENALEICLLKKKEQPGLSCTPCKKGK